MGVCSPRFPHTGRAPWGHRPGGGGVPVSEGSVNSYRALPGEAGYRDWSHRASARAQQRAMRALAANHPEDYKRFYREELQRAPAELNLPPLESECG